MQKLLPFLFLSFFINTSLWAADVSPKTIDGATTVSAADAKALFDNEALFVDVRKDSDWDAGRVPGAVHLDNKKGIFTEASLSAEIGKDEKVVIYCNGEKCPRSAKGSKSAVSWGFTKVFYFRDGMPAWKSAGYPVE